MPPSQQSRLRALVVDDEPLARQRIVDLLSEMEPQPEIIEAGDGETAMILIQTRTIDVVFLDVQMPGLSGLDLIQAIGVENMPMTVFVTAYDSHAVKAFEAAAVDYLLKPFSEDRFWATIRRVESRLADPSRSNFRTELAQAAADIGVGRWDRLVVKTTGLTRLVRAEDIDLIESAGVYVTLHLDGKQILYRAYLQELGARLDPNRFIRVNRSAIMNLDSVLQLEAISHGEFEVTLKNGARTKVTRSFRPNLESRLGQPL